MLQRGGHPRYAVFDCLFLNGNNLRRKTLSTRRTALEKELRDGHGLILSRRLAANGFEAFRIAKNGGLKAWSRNEWNRSTWKDEAAIGAR